MFGREAAARSGAPHRAPGRNFLICKPRHVPAKHLRLAPLGPCLPAHGGCPTALSVVHERGGFPGQELLPNEHLVMRMIVGPRVRVRASRMGSGSSSTHPNGEFSRAVVLAAAQSIHQVAAQGALLSRPACQARPALPWPTWLLEGSPTPTTPPPPLLPLQHAMAGVLAAPQPREGFVRLWAFRGGCLLRKGAPVSCAAVPALSAAPWVLGLGVLNPKSR